VSDVEHDDGGSGSRDHDRCQIERKADEHQRDARPHAPQDRVSHDPVEDVIDAAKDTLIHAKDKVEEAIDKTKDSTHRK
jgi:hypothetical protein